MMSISTYNNELLDKLIDDMGSSVIDHVIDYGVDHSSDDEPLNLTDSLPNVGGTETCISETIVCDPILANGIGPAAQRPIVKHISATSATSDENRDLNVGLEPCMYSNDVLPSNDLFNGALAEIENEFDVNDSIDYGEEIHRCSICGDEYNWKQSLQRHMLSHIKTPKPQVFQCKLCHEKRSTKSGLKLHMSRHTVTVYECSVCKAVCSSSTDLSAHLKSHSKSQGKRFVCEVCKKSFSKKSTLTTHASTHSELEKSLRAAPGPAPRGLEWNCGICNASFPHERQLVKHRRRHEGKRAFECGSCDQSFSQETHLIRHQKTHEKRSIDEIYDEKYYKETNKHGDTSYQDENVSQAVNVSVNIKGTEEDGTTYQCQTCSKYFGLIDFVGHDCKGKYQARPFKCDFCSKAFKLSSHLIRHKATVHVVTHHEYGVGSGYTTAMNSKRQRSSSEKLSHTREKPSLCTYCNKFFSRRHDLKRHQELKRCKMMTRSTPTNWAEQPIVRAKTSPSSQDWNESEIGMNINSELSGSLDDVTLVDDSTVDDILTNMKIDPDSLEDSGIDDPFGLVEALVFSSASSLMDDSSLDSMPEAASIDTLTKLKQSENGDKKDIKNSMPSMTNNEESLFIKLEEDSKSQKSSLTQCSEYNHDFISDRSLSLSPLSSGHEAHIQYFPLSVAEEVLADVSTEIETTNIFPGLGSPIDESQLPFAMETVLGDDSEGGEIDVCMVELPPSVTTC